MKKNFFYNLLLSLVNILFPILTFPYASHILGPVGIGKVQFAVSFAQYFALFAALGIPIYGVKETARYRDDPHKLATTFTELTLINFIASLLVCVIYFTIIYSLPFFSQNRSLYLFGGCLIFFSFTYTDWFYSGIEAFRAITLRSILVKLISLVLLYLFVKTEADFDKYLLIILFSILGNQVLSFVLVFRKTHFNFKTLQYRKHLKPILYIFGASVAASIYTLLDTVLLGFLSNHEAVGLYTAAIKLVKISIPFVTSMGVILMPGIAKNFADNDLTGVRNLLYNSFNFLVVFTIPVCTGMALLAPEFIEVFSGQKFAPAAVSMQVLSVLPLLIGFGHFFSFQVLIPIGKNRETFLSMSVGVVTCLALNFLLVPFLKEKGAAIATVCTELVVTSLYIFFVKKHLSLTYNWRFVQQSLAAVILFIPIVWLTRQLALPVIFTLLSSVITCVVTYALLQLFVFKNIFLFNFIPSFLKRSPSTKYPDNE